MEEGILLGTLVFVGGEVGSVLGIEDGIMLGEADNVHFAKTSLSTS